MEHLAHPRLQLLLLVPPWDMHPWKRKLWPWTVEGCYTWYSRVARDLVPTVSC